MQIFKTELLGWELLLLLQVFLQASFFNSPEELEICLPTSNRILVSFMVTSFFIIGSSVKPVIATVLYYIFLLTPLILLLVWVILLGVNVGVNPCLPVLFTGIFIIILFIPSYSSWFYIKVLALFISFMVAEILTMTLIFNREYLSFNSVLLIHFLL